MFIILLKGGGRMPSQVLYRLSTGRSFIRRIKTGFWANFIGQEGEQIPSEVVYNVIHTPLGTT